MRRHNNPKKYVRLSSRFVFHIGRIYYILKDSNILPPFNIKVKQDRYRKAAKPPRGTEGVNY